MDEIFDKKSQENDSDIGNTGLGHIGDMENDYKNDYDSQKGIEEDRKVFETKKEDSDEKAEAPSYEKENAQQESEADKEKGKELEKGVNISARYVRPTYSASYYASVTETPVDNKKKIKRFSVGVLVAVASVCVVLSLVLGAFSGVMVGLYLKDIDNQEWDYASGDDADPKDIVTDSGITINKNNSPTKIDEVIENDEEEAMSIVEVVDTVSASVVEVSTLTTSNYGQFVSGGAGSGVIIAQGEGYAYIVTNYHVVGGSDFITVRLTNKNEYEAEYIDGDEKDDIAIIRIEESEELCVAKIGSSDALRVGEGVVAIGNPLGELGGTVTDGIVSALDREITIDGVTMTLLQTNAAVNPGNSGGGLFNMAGRLIGIVNAKHQQSGIEGLGFAIPIDLVYDDLLEIIEDGYIHGRVTIGVEAIYLDRISASYYFRSGKEGVYVISSEGNEFKVGDRITHIGVSQINTEADYNAAISALDIGTQVMLKVVRGNSVLEITVDVREYIPEGVEVSN